MKQNPRKRRQSSFNLFTWGGYSSLTIILLSLLIIISASSCRNPQLILPPPVTAEDSGKEPEGPEEPSSPADPSYLLFEKYSGKATGSIQDMLNDPDTSISQKPILKASLPQMR